MANYDNQFKPGAGAATWLLILVLISTIVFTLAFAAGAGGFSSDLGGDPDEAAHAVTSLMLRDYLTVGLGQHPMHFAKAYYADFPRVALGHYPPLYYVLTAPLLLVYNSVSTLLLFQALTLSLLAALTYLIGCRFLKPVPAAVASLSILLLPLALKLTLHVMSDILLATLCLWAAMLWAWYLQAPTLRKSLIWGCVAAAAILSKGSGMGLCLLPPLGTLLAGRWRLIFTWSWWCAALPVAVLAGPWMIYSTGISKEGMTLLTPSQYFVQAVPFYLKGMPAVFGWPLTLLAVTAAVVVSLHLWDYYMEAPWTRDGHVHADIIQVAPDVSGLVTELHVRDNQKVSRGQVLFVIFTFAVIGIPAWAYFAGSREEFHKMVVATVLWERQASPLAWTVL
ncbi:MAG: hypothetical protein B7Z37_11675, partial [Verrucomicrobia bacterium 12-59-8]